MSPSVASEAVSTTRPAKKPAEAPERSPAHKRDRHQCAEQQVERSVERLERVENRQLRDRDQNEHDRRLDHVERHCRSVRMMTSCSASKSTAGTICTRL